MKRLLTFCAAAISLSAAFFILIQMGLPQRAAFTGQVVPGQLPVAPEVDAVAPNFEQMSLNGQVISLRELQGSPVVLNFWATWCVPCQVEMPILQAFYEQHQEQGMRLLAINIGETASTVREWQQAMGLTYDILLDEQQAVAAAYRLRGQPSTFVISPNGVIKQIFYGPISQSALEAALAPYFS
ncbi:MAG: TlpA family protein disulfide reductase [Anaerolineae bacterium]|nr:TlpA family protein disulfide reductase [Anaerolineae bacterium]